jgi:hypothetical protein
MFQAVTNLIERKLIKTGGSHGKVILSDPKVINEQ